MFDLIIVGGGPSGSTLARVLGDRFRILVLDKRNLLDSNGFRNRKSCGGLLAPDAQAMLAKMSLGLPDSVLVGPQLFTVRTLDLKNDLECFYQRHYININREKFDRWLVSLIPDSVDLRPSTTFTELKQETDSIEVTFNQNGKEYKEKSRFLIGADGAFSSVSRKAFPDRPLIKTYITIQEIFESPDPLPYFSAIFDPELTDFYAWTIPKDSHLIVGAALAPGKDAQTRFKKLCSKLEKLGFQLNKSISTEGSFLLRPQNARCIYPGNGRILLIGESAGWISPSSAEGLSYGFRSALALSTALNKYAEPEKVLKEFKKQTLSLRNNIRYKLLKSPFMYNNFLRKTVMKTGLKSMKMFSLKEEE